MAADNLDLSDAERDLVLAHRTAADAKRQKQQQADKPPDLDDIKAGMSPATKRKIAERILELWR